MMLEMRPDCGGESTDRPARCAELQKKFPSPTERKFERCQNLPAS